MGAYSRFQLFYPEILHCLLLGVGSCGGEQGASVSGLEGLSFYTGGIMEILDLKSLVLMRR